MEFEVAPKFLMDDSQEKQASPEQGECTDEDVKKPLEEAMGSNPKEHVIDKVPGASSDEDHCVIVDEIEVKKGPKIQKPIVDQREGHQKIVETTAKCLSTVVQPVRPEAMVEPRVRTDLPACIVTERRRPLHLQRPLLGERFAQLCGPWVRTPVYDLSINRSFHEEAPSYREVEEEVVTVTNDLAPLPINFFGTDNSEYPLNETQRFWDDHADHTPPLLHRPLTRSRQTTPVPHQTVAVTFQPLAGTNHTSARSQHPSSRSHLASSNYQRENGPHFVPPGQENSGYFPAEENIDPHP
nr:uncharacterized protein LOC121825700 isoform X2 [Peromyscus maniculatus bairdii]